MVRLKKFINILFLLIAGMTMLAFTAIPHHHHEEYICFNALHCEGESHAEGHSHDDSPLETEEGCVRHLLQTQVSRPQSLANHTDTGQDISYLQHSFLTSHTQELQAQGVIYHSVSPVPYRERLHSACHISTQAGRAPPTGCR